MTSEEIRRAVRVYRDAQQQAGAKIDAYDMAAVQAFRAKVAEAEKANHALQTIDVTKLRQITADAARVSASPAPPRRGSVAAPRRRTRPRVDEEIARRVARRNRGRATAFMRKAGLSEELGHLFEVESRLGKGTDSDCKYAAFGARNLLEGIANRLFLPSSEAHRDRWGGEHSLGPKDHKNRVIAFVDRRLGHELSNYDLRAFVSTMDVIMRWTGSGPHGTHAREDAEGLYIRLLEALAVIARAHATG